MSGKIQRKEINLFYPTISFVVLAFNNEGEIANCIKKLFNYASRYPGFVEIFIIDNGSQDNTYEIAYATMELGKKKCPRVRTKLMRFSTKLDISEILEICFKAALGQKIAIVRCGKTGIKAKFLKPNLERKALSYT